MNKATAREMKVRFYGSNSAGEYYKINESHNVIHLTQGAYPFVCLDCRMNSCDHIEAVKDHLEMVGVRAA